MEPCFMAKPTKQKKNLPLVTPHRKEHSMHCCRCILGTIGPCEFQGIFLWTNPSFALFSGEFEWTNGPETSSKVSPGGRRLPLVHGWLFPATDKANIGIREREEGRAQGSIGRPAFLEETPGSRVGSTEATV